MMSTLPQPFAVGRIASFNVTAVRECSCDWLAGAALALLNFLTLEGSTRAGRR